MSPDALARFSQRMVTATLLFLVAVVFIDLTVLFFPALSFSDELLGITFSLSDRILSNLDVSLRTLPWWQATGAALITLLVLSPLCYGLYQLRSLFCTYARRDYFSANAARYMKKVGASIGIWMVLTLLADPVLSYWLTMLKPAGERTVLFSFELSYLAWLFLSACVMIVARILEKASALNEENKLFI